MAAASYRRSLVAKVAASYLRRNSVSVDQIGELISLVGDALEQAMIAGTAADTTALQSAASIKKSVQRDYIACLECAKHAVTFKRRLRTAHGMTPQQYREKWRLPRDYPMTAPAYSEHRSQMAKAVGLGQKAGTAMGTKVTRRSRTGRPTGASVAAS